MKMNRVPFIQIRIDYGYPLSYQGFGNTQHRTCTVNRSDGWKVQPLTNTDQLLGILDHDTRPKSASAAAMAVVCSEQPMHSVGFLEVEDLGMVEVWIG